jgi:microcystin-dependent protein
MTEGTATGEALIGEVRMFAGNSQPVGWAFCDGRLLNIGDFPALYGVIGTTFGGDGVEDFAVPDLRGRVPMGHGGGTGLTNHTLGQQVGVESVALNADQLPAHIHTVQATNTTGDSASPGGNVLAASRSSESLFHSPGAALVNLGATTGSAGSGSPVSTVQPSLVLNFIIALQGRDPRGSAAILVPTSLVARS